MGDGAAQRQALTPNAISLVLGVVGLLSIWTTSWAFPIKCGLTLFALGTIAVLAIQQDKDQTERLARWIEDGGYGQSYRRLVGPRLLRIWCRLCDPTPKTAGALGTLRGALTWRVLDLAMLLAVAYPILAMTLVWAVTAQDATLGGETVIEAVPRLGQDHLASLGVIGIWIGVIVMKSRSQYRLAKGINRADILSYAAVGLSMLLIWLDVIEFAGTMAFAVAGIFAFAVTGAVAVAVSLVVAIAYAVANAVAATVTGPGSVAVSVVLAVAVTAAVVWMDEKEHQRIGRGLLILFLCAALPIAAAMIPWEDVSVLTRAILVFFGLFPILNALFDALSYAITLALVRHGLRLKVLPALALGLLDLCIAGVLYFALGATLVAAVAGLNALADVQIINIRSLLDDVADGLSPASAWAYLMVLSTIVPTLLHLALTLLSLERAALPGLRTPFARILRDGRTRGWQSLAAPLMGGAAAVLPVACLYVLWLVIWHFAADVITAYGQTYMHWLMNLAIWIEAI